ncbi:MAG TPA: hypothetical protein VFF13_05560 [archaeon]|nr:hypothetical protein [archaeon]
MLKKRIYGSGIEGRTARIREVSPKGQVSVEYLVLTGFILLVAGVIFGFALVSFNENSSFAKAQAVVGEVINQSNLVASWGDESAVFFWIDVPPNAQGFEASGKQVTITLNQGVGANQVFGYTRVNMTPVSLPTTQGLKYMKATFSDGNVTVVEIVE